LKTKQAPGCGTGACFARVDHRTHDLAEVSGPTIEGYAPSRSLASGVWIEGPPLMGQVDNQTTA
jgi:hypothetical protein